MQTSIPSLKKPSQWMKHLKVLVLITFLQLQLSSKLIINAVDFDPLFDFNLESLKYEETEKKLDFTKGTWTYINDKGLLEFAPEEPTMLIFEPKNSSQFIYLEKDKRVLVFDLNEKENDLPYVSETHKIILEGEDTSNFNEFFNSAEHSLQDLQDALDKIYDTPKFKNLSSDELNKIKEIITRVNVIPYYNVVGKNEESNFKNKIGFFLKDNGSGLFNWAHTKGFLTNDWVKMISYKNHTIFKETLIIRLVLVLFFKNPDFLALMKLCPEDQANAMLLYESIMYQAMELIYIIEIEDSFEKLINFFSIIAGRMTSFFYTQKNYPVFNDLFNPRKSNQYTRLADSTWNQYLDLRKKKRKNYLDFDTLSSVETVFNVYVSQNSSEIQEGLEEEEKEAKEALLHIADTLFDSMSDIVVNVGKQKLMMKEFFSEFVKNESEKDKEKIQNCYKEANILYEKSLYCFHYKELNKDDKDEILKFIQEKDFMFFAEDFVRTLYVPFCMEAFEDRVMRNLSDFPVISAMGLKFSDDDDGVDAFRVFRNMLSTVNIYNYDPYFYFQKPTNFVKRSIFTWEEGRRMLLI